MSIKDLEQRLSALNDDVAESNIGIAVIIEKLKHIPTNEELDERIDKRVESKISTYLKVAKVSYVLLGIGVLLFTGVKIF